MTKEHVMEQLGLSYVTAVSAMAGMAVEPMKQDYGIDGSIKDVQYDEIEKRYWNTGFSIDFQLKSTTKYEVKDGQIIYDLEIKNYKDLIRTDVGTDRILILYLMPQEKTLWLQIQDEETRLRKNAWWFSLRGMPDVLNKATKRIKIPEDNIFDVEAVSRMMDIIKSGKNI